MENTAKAVGLCMKDEAAQVVRTILDDYQGGRAIDKISSAQAPNRDVVIRILHELFGCFEIRRITSECNRRNLDFNSLAFTHDKNINFYKTFDRA